MTREKGDNVEDGADEKMLASDDKEQLARKDEVKFIQASDRSNGDAKIDIGNIEKVSVNSEWTKINRLKSTQNTCNHHSIMRDAKWFRDKNCYKAFSPSNCSLYW